MSVAGKRVAVMLGEEDTFQVRFEGRDEYVEVDGRGRVFINSINTGSTQSVFSSAASNMTLQGQLHDTPTRTKLENISNYLYMLGNVQQSGHDVHKEIDEALKQYRKEAGF